MPLSVMQNIVLSFDLSIIWKVCRALRSGFTSISKVIHGGGMGRDVTRCWFRQTLQMPLSVLQNIVPSFGSSIV